MKPRKPPTAAPPIAPQPGPQSQFLSSPADIAIYGGAAGGGKTWALLMEPLRHLANPGFGAVIFRRTMVQVRNEGALWDESEALYPRLGGRGARSALEWRFPSGASVRFGHLEHDKTAYDWQGAQLALIGFDELTHFSARQFWYLLGRNRSTCGVRPYVRATCNPDADSWIRMCTGTPEGYNAGLYIQGTCDVRFAGASTVQIESGANAVALFQPWYGRSGVLTWSLENTASVARYPGSASAGYLGLSSYAGQGRMALVAGSINSSATTPIDSGIRANGYSGASYMAGVVSQA